MAADLDVDEWDGVGSFAQHAVSGSIAGLMEHSVMFPVDTIKTAMHVRRTPQLAVDGGRGSLGMLASFEHMAAAEGGFRMWRGGQTMLTGCVPAHAAYFSIYEGCKARFNRESSGGAGAAAGGEGGNSAFASGAAVALATMAHDVIMTPMDCIKQRLQLGHHKNSLVDCANAMLRQEGPRAFLRSYPTTLMMNAPYAVVMGTANEAIRGVLNPNGSHSLPTYLVAGAGAGVIAAAITNPLDVVKTRLQTQNLHLATASGEPLCSTTCTVTATSTPAGGIGGGGAPCPRAPLAETPQLAYTGMVQAARTLWREEGASIFARGMGARMMIHAPSVAICWTTYESVKHLLGRWRLFE